MSDHVEFRVLASRAEAFRLSRRGFLGGALGLGAGALLSACGGSGGSSSGAAGQLNMYTWGEYNDPDVIGDFPDAIQVDTYGSNEEMIAKLVAARGTSGYDIVVPTGTFIPQMSQNGLLAQLDLARLPNFDKLQAEFRAQSWDPENTYSVCKDWGTTGFAYDSTKITRPLTSWADFLDAAQNEASGATSVLEDPHEVLGIATYTLGYDSNTTDQAELDASEQLLVAQLAPHLSTFDSYPSGAMSEGASMLVQAWNGDARQGILAAGDYWTWVFPTEGANLWMDNYCIVEGSENTDAAYEFIDYALDPATSLRELAYIGYHTGIDDIQATAEAEGLERLDMVFLTEEQLAKLSPMVVNEAQQRITDIMSAVRAAAGS